MEISARVSCECHSYKNAAPVVSIAYALAKAASFDVTQSSKINGLKKVKIHSSPRKIWLCLELHHDDVSIISSIANFTLQNYSFRVFGSLSSTAKCANTRRHPWQKKVLPKHLFRPEFIHPGPISVGTA